MTATKQYYCHFGLSPEYVDALKQGPMQVSGADAEGDVRVIGWPSHSFFIGTLLVPQARSTPEQPHPLVSVVLTAVAGLSNS